MREIVQNLRQPDGTLRFGLNDLYEETYTLQAALFQRGQDEGSLRSGVNTRYLAVAEGSDPASTSPGPAMAGAPGPAVAAARTSAGTDSNQSTVRRTPSWARIRGRHPRASLARLITGHRRAGSSAGSGRNSMGEADPVVRSTS